MLKGKVMSTEPDKIYLHDPLGCFDEDTEAGDNNTVTWSEERIDENDYEYVKSDCITDDICFICKKPTQNLSANPAKWRIDLPFDGGNGSKRSYHQGCIVQKLAVLADVRSDVELALKLSKHVHDACKEVPHDIGLKLTEIVSGHFA
jgi:hypothetical protein